MNVASAGKLKTSRLAGVLKSVPRIGTPTIIFPGAVVVGSDERIWRSYFANLKHGT